MSRYISAHRMNYIWQLNDQKDLLRTAFSCAVTHLRAPAGPHYQTREDIQRDELKFGRAFHNGLFQFHIQNTQNILLAEEQMKARPNNPTAEQQTSKRGWQHLRQIFRTLNDCIAWTVFREPSFTINRLCRHRPRGYLRDQNPDSALKIITDLSKTGDTLAIWNDATRSIDLQDVTAISLKPRQISFIEIKEGPINGEIFEVLKGCTEAEVLKRMEEFASRRGATGLQQLERFIKQRMHADKLHTLASNDDVEDPFTENKRIATSPPQPLAHYDQMELAGLLEEVREKEFASMTVDNCLHVLAVNQRRRMSNTPIDSLIEKELKDRMTTPSNGEPDCRGIMVPLQETLYSPISMPVMIRPLEPLDIADICIGNVVLFFMFDVNAWARLFQECRLSWSSVKEGRREQSKPFLARRMVIDGRIPIITPPSGNFSMHLGDRIISRLICEGIRPSSMANYHEELLAHEQPHGGHWIEE